MKLNRFMFVAIMLIAGVASAAPLSATRVTPSKNGGVQKSYKMKASTQIYAGGMVMIDSNGVALPAAAGVGNRGVVGVATESKLSGASVAMYITVQEGWFEFDATTIAITDTAKIVYAEDDHTFDETVGANEPVAGILLEYKTASKGWIYIGSFIQARTNTITEPVVLTDALTLKNAAVFDNTPNGAFSFTEAGEDMVCTMTSNLVTFSSTTSATFAFTPAVALADSLTFSDGAILDQSANNKFSITENSEDAELTFSSNLVTFGSTTSATYAFTPAVSFTGAISPVGGISTTVAAAANAACTATCAAKSCIVGFDTGTSAFVACATATADTCVCGP